MPGGMYDFAAVSPPGSQVVLTFGGVDSGTGRHRDGIGLYDRCGRIVRCSMGCFGVSSCVAVYCSCTRRCCSVADAAARLQSALAMPASQQESCAFGTLSQLRWAASQPSADYPTHNLRTAFVTATVFGPAKLGSRQGSQRLIGLSQNLIQHLYFVGVGVVAQSDARLVVLSVRCCPPSAQQGPRCSCLG
jgi:hypothetical protein